MYQSIFSREKKKKITTYPHKIIHLFSLSFKGGKIHAKHLGTKTTQSRKYTSKTQKINIVIIIISPASTNPKPTILRRMLPLDCELFHQAPMAKMVHQRLATLARHHNALLPRHNDRVDDLVLGMVNREHLKPVEILRLHRRVQERACPVRAAHHEHCSGLHVACQVLDNLPLLFSLHPHQCSQEHHIVSVLLNRQNYLTSINLVKEKLVANQILGKKWMEYPLSDRFTSMISEVRNTTRSAKP